MQVSVWRVEHGKYIHTTFLSSKFLPFSEIYAVNEEVLKRGSELFSDLRFLAVKSYRNVYVCAPNFRVETEQILMRAQSNRYNDIKCQIDYINIGRISRILRKLSFNLYIREFLLNMSTIYILTAA